MGLKNERRNPNSRNRMMMLTDALQCYNWARDCRFFPFNINRIRSVSDCEREKARKTASSSSCGAHGCCAGAHFHHFLSSLGKPFLSSMTMTGECWMFTLQHAVDGSNDDADIEDPFERAQGENRMHKHCWFVNEFRWLLSVTEFAIGLTQHEERQQFPPMRKYFHGLRDRTNLQKFSICSQRGIFRALISRQKRGKHFHAWFIPHIRHGDYFWTQTNEMFMMMNLF